MAAASPFDKLRARNISVKGVLVLSLSKDESAP